MEKDLGTRPATGSLSQPIRETSQGKRKFTSAGQSSQASKGRLERVVMGIDPGLANTGWGIVQQSGPRLTCLAYGCVSTPAGQPLAERLLKIHNQIGAVIERFNPLCVGIETVWFGQNVTAAFATGQARGAALVACAEGGVAVGEFSPRQIKLAIVGTGTADKEQVQYMVRQLLALEEIPHPDHAADALAAAICYTTHDGYARTAQRLDTLVARAEARDRLMQENVRGMVYE